VSAMRMMVGSWMRARRTALEAGNFQAAALLRRQPCPNLAAEIVVLGSQRVVGHRWDSLGRIDPGMRGRFGAVPEVQKHVEGPA
jgi:hypothetical protein